MLLWPLALAALQFLQYVVLVDACHDLDQTAVKWIWIGGLTSNSVRFKVSIDMNKKNCNLEKVVMWLQQENHGKVIKQLAGGTTLLDNSVEKTTLISGTQKEMADGSVLCDFKAKELTAGAWVYKLVYYDNDLIIPLSHSNRPLIVPPPTGTPYSFKFAFSSCADEDSDPSVFMDIMKHDPQFFVHMGDLHYANLEVNQVEAFHDAYESMFASDAGRAMLNMGLPMAYMWDDHDFGPDNSDKTARGRNASLTAYRDYVPHYPLRNELTDLLGSIEQSFTIGRVRYILTDLRSQRVPNESPDIPSKTILGPEQKKWFFDQLISASNDPSIALIVWVNTMPWIDDERKWGHFTYEQKEVVQFIRDNNLNTKKTPLIIISGDAHMVAVDDGSNSPGNLPTFHAAALGRPGSIKGGPYSHGAFPGSGQYGVMDVKDDGGQICLLFSGRRGEDELVSFDTCHPVAGSPYHPPWKSVRVVMRTWKKMLSRLQKRWKRLKYQSVALFLMLLFAVITISVIARRLKPHGKKD